MGHLRLESDDVVCLIAAGSFVTGSMLLDMLGFCVISLTPKRPAVAQVVALRQVEPPVLISTSLLLKGRCGISHMAREHLLVTH